MYQIVAASKLDGEKTFTANIDADMHGIQLQPLFKEFELVINEGLPDELTYPRRVDHKIGVDGSKKISY